MTPEERKRLIDEMVGRIRAAEAAETAQRPALRHTDIAIAALAVTAAMLHFVAYHAIMTPLWFVAVFLVLIWMRRS